MLQDVVATFDNIVDAQSAVIALKDNGIASEQISLIARDNSIMPNEHSDQYDPERGVASGTSTGAIFGGATGILVGLAALAIPGVGPIVAAGPIIGALTGAGLGAAAGGAMGALNETGIPPAASHEYEEAIRRGGTLIIVQVAEKDTEWAMGLLTASGGKDLKEQAKQWAPLNGNEGEPAQEGRTPHHHDNVPELNHEADLMRTSGSAE